MIKHIDCACSKNWILKLLSYTTFPMIYASEELVSMLWSAITLEGINAMVYITLHVVPSCGEVFYSPKHLQVPPWGMSQATE